MNNNEFFQNQLEFGEEAERIVNDYLISQGYFTLPLYQFRRVETELTGTPSFKYISKYGFTKEIPSPDIIVCGKGENFFCEVKRKQSWVDKKYSSRLETGLDRPRLEEYFKLMENSNMDLHIYFVQEEQEPIGIYRIIITNENRNEVMESVREKPQYVRKSHNYIKTEWMAFFGIKNLEKIK